MSHLLTLFAGSRAYGGRVQATPGLIGYWPLDEAAGVVAYDRSGNGRNGAHTGVTLGQPGIGDGRTSPLYDGVNDYTNIAGASLAGAFNGAEGSLIVWAKVSGAGVWTDGANREPLRLAGALGNNFVLFRKTVNANEILLSYKAGTVTESAVTNIGPSTEWFCLAMTWSKGADVVVHYANGMLLETDTVLGTWNEVLTNTQTVIGASSNTPASPWSGTLAHASLYNRALSAAEIANLSRV